MALSEIEHHKLADARREVAQLEEAVRRLIERRDLAARRRRRTLLTIGILVSLIVHIGLIIYLSLIHRMLPGGSSGQEVSIEFAVLNEEQLSGGGHLALEAVDAVSESADAAATLDALADLDAVPPAGLQSAGGSGASALGGLGAGLGGGSGIGGSGGLGSGTGIGAGSGSASFFGIGAKGTRFAYIVDRSSSMLRSRKIEIAKRELARSIDSLPDYAYFHVVFFSSSLLLPEMQEAWLRARKSTVQQFIRWLDKSVVATGGTIPAPAFMEVFSLPVRPDVVFFMTDGEIVGFTAEDVAGMNRRGKHVIINTIAFGDPTSQELLQQIARQSGGVYRFVPADGM